MDKVLEGFLKKQFEEGMALADASDLLDLMPLDPPVPQRYIATFSCTGLVRQRTGAVTEANHFEVGIWMPDDFLCVADPFRVLTWFRPRHIWHPNISNRDPFICVGRMLPGTGLVDLLTKIHEIITYNKVTMREDDALNKECCAWARRNIGRFPVDRRSLRRRALDISVETIEVAK
jgi:hypothetical protein